MSKQQLIKRVRSLGFGDILFANTESGMPICINDYDEDSDTFNIYDETMKCREVGFEEIKSFEWRHC